MTDREALIERVAEALRDQTAAGTSWSLEGLRPIAEVALVAAGVLKPREVDASSEGPA